jgi:hypothetical protein
MATCHVCKHRFPLRGLNRRLALPEYRSAIGFWPWLRVRVCDDCVERHDRDFLERLRLLAPDVLANEEPIVGMVCLACGTTSSDGPWRRVSKWIDAAGQPVRQATFHLCGAHAHTVYIDGIVVTSNFAARLDEVLDVLPVAGAQLLERNEGWRPGEGDGPPGAGDFTPGRSRDETRTAVKAFWRDRLEDVAARAAWLGPVRKDYRMRYRLDVVRDLHGGRRETLVVVRTGDDAFSTYLLTSAPAREGP